MITDVPAVAGLPPGHRARPFAEADRETLVAARNREVHELQRGTAVEWAEWEAMQPQPDRLRLTVEAPGGAVAGTADLSSGFIKREDGTLFGGVGVVREHRGKGIGGALLAVVEAEARRRSAPRILADTNEAFTGGLEWAVKRGYREIGRRIESYVELAAFDPAPFADILAGVRSAGLGLATFAERLAGGEQAGRDAFFRELYEAEGPMWEDIPWASPMPHWPFEQFRRMIVESGKLLPDLSLVALDGERIVGLTTTGKRQDRDGYTWMTGVGREHRGRGLALALKVEALTRAKAAGLRALLTTNDEPNKAMRSINARLGYRALPASIELEKRL
ncbi:MAG: GNAT family N-acetyltransferase [Candidatus Limnocylindria bacterium]